MQFKGKIREQWGKLTDDEIDQMQGNAEMVIGKIQERYGRSREERNASSTSGMSGKAELPSNLLRWAPLLTLTSQRRRPLM